MESDSSYRKWDSAEEVELSLPEASGARRGRKALCLPESTQGKAIAILYVLLMLCFVVFTALVAVRLGNLSQGLEDAQLDRETIRRDAKRNLSDLQHDLESKMSNELGGLSSQLLNVSEELAGLRRGMEKIQADQVKDPSTLQKVLEIRNLTHRLSQELAEMKQAHGGLQEAVTKVQEELQRVKGSTCTECPSGWEVFEKNCYFFSSVTKSWEDAKQACIDQGSQLVIVNTNLEQVFLAAHVTDPHVYWLGLSDSAAEGEWRWLDGSPLTIRFWEPGEPNNVGPDGEDCGSLRHSGKWNDIKCSAAALWVCERPC
ncbi:C-type lectin domain family 4 member E-like isoform X2 [Pelodiscus sinensis]|uniref:C-type lectin domain family 4 member E-like isoform X2 n=1 Tax=Pelodiscus sinensis TaxID=13735 RepID=UPI003F6D97F7